MQRDIFSRRRSQIRAGLAALQRTSVGVITRIVLVAVVFLSLIVSYTTAQPQYSDWSAPVNLGPVVNSAFNDAGPTISKNGRSLYFHSNRPWWAWRRDIWVSQRNTEEEPWGPPINLGPVINTTAVDISARPVPGWALAFLLRATAQEAKALTSGCPTANTSTTTSPGSLR